MDYLLNKITKKCYRCAVDKCNLCNPSYPIHATEMDNEKRIVVYEQAAKMSSQDAAAKYLSQNYGLNNQVPWFLFLASMRLPEQLMSDLLHTWGINIPIWVLSLFWYILNEEGRKLFLEYLKDCGLKYNNSYITRLFKTKKGLMIDEKLGLTEIRKTIHMQVSFLKNVFLCFLKKLANFN